MEFKADKVTLFYAELYVHMAVKARPEPVPVKVAHEAELVAMVIELGITILILPAEERASVVTTVNVQDVTELTDVVVMAAVPDIVLGDAVSVVVPTIFLYPFWKKVNVKVGVGSIEGGAV